MGLPILCNLPSNDRFSSFQKLKYVQISITNGTKTDFQKMFGRWFLPQQDLFLSSIEATPENRSFKQNHWVIKERANHHKNRQEEIPLCFSVFLGTLSSCPASQNCTKVQKEYFESYITEQILTLEPWILKSFSSVFRFSASSSLISTSVWPVSFTDGFSFLQFWGAFHFSSVPHCCAVSAKKSFNSPILYKNQRKTSTLIIIPNQSFHF